MQHIKISQVGLNTKLYEFKDKELFTKYWNQLEGKGKLTQVFINNRYAFEFKKSKKIIFK